VGLERGSLSLVNTTVELLERKSSGSGLEILNYRRWGSTAPTIRETLLSSKFGTNVADKRRSLEDSCHRVYFLF
jgi:hypothetical protein